MKAFHFNFLFLFCFYFCLFVFVIVVVVVVAFLVGYRLLDILNSELGYVILPLSNSFQLLKIKIRFQ